ncbi:TetR/AcrR family transcriptional regulator [Chloroflexota bacterium]
MNGFQRRREQKNERIRGAALDLFSAYGFKKTSISDIAEKAGVSKVTIYKYFGDKDSLVLDIVKSLFTAMMERYRSIIEEDLAFQDKLQQIILDKAEWGRYYKGDFLKTVISNDPEIRQYVDTMYKEEINPLLLNFFEEGKRQGYVCSNLSQEAILLFSVILREGLITRLDISSDTDQNVKLLSDIIHLYLYGVLGGK